MHKLLIILFLLPVGLLAQEEETKYKTFINFNGSSSFLKNDTKYFNLSFGIKAKCKYKFGVNYGWLRGTYKTEDYPVDLLQYPNAQSETRTDIKFYSVMFEPILIKEKKFNISTPINVGFSDLLSEYKESALNYSEYHKETPFFASVALDADFRILAFMKIGLTLGYRHVFSDLDLATNEFSTPFIGVGIKIGKLCKE